MCPVKQVEYQYLTGQIQHWSSPDSPNLRIQMKVVLLTQTRYVHSIITIHLPCILLLILSHSNSIRLNSILMLGLVESILTLFRLIIFCVLIDPILILIFSNLMLRLTLPQIHPTAYQIHKFHFLLFMSLKRYPETFHYY